MIDAVKDYAIFTLDPTGHIVTWNSGARAIKGYDAAEVVGRHIEIFYGREDRAAGRPRKLLAIAERDGRVEDEGWRYRKDGTRFWADVVISAMRAPDGTLLGFVKVTRDLTERRQLEQLLREREERLRLMIGSIQDYAIFLLDPEGHIASWNPGAERIKGYRAEEIVGRHFSMFYPPEDAAAGRPARELEIARREGRYAEEAWRVRKDGTRFWANVVLAAVRNEQGELVGFTKVTRDMTDRRRQQEELLAAEREAAELRVRAERAQEVVRERDEFISIAAHELRTPIAALRLKLDGILRISERGSPIAEPARSRLVVSSRLVNRMSDLVERMLDVSRIVLGQLELDVAPMDLGEVVREIVDELREPSAASGSEVRISLRGDARGTWDRMRLGQVIANLLSNALRYGRGKPIDIVVEGDGEKVRATVADHGIGMSASDMQRVFGRFERAAPADQYAGLGLGLYISQHVVEAHGGTITVASTPGEGAQFVIELPRERP